MPNDIEPEDPQVSINPLAEQVTHIEFQTTFQVFDQAMMT